MIPLRGLAVLLLSGENGEFIRHDLDEMRARDRARGLPAWRADVRYARALAASVISLWRNDVEWLTELRGGSVRQDLVFALRIFRKHPVPISIAIGGLALAIGVVASAFSIVNATVLRPYAMDAPSSVVSINRPNHPTWVGWPYGQFRQMRESTTLATLEAANPERVRFSTARDTDGLTDRRMLVVSGGYLQMLGGRPAIGRSIVPSDDLPGSPPVIAVSHRFWQTALNSNPAVVGRTMWVKDVPATLIGVLQRDFTGPVREPIAIWGTFAAFGDAQSGLETAGSGAPTVEVYGRLTAGATMLTLQQNLRAVLGLPDVPAVSSHESGDDGLQVYSAASPSAGYGEADVRMGVTMVFTVVLLVLALACANTANLLMASAMTRVREVGVRLAMGATRGRLIRQMLSESLLLGSIAGAFGLLLAFWLVPIFGASVALPQDANLAPDWRVLIFTVAVTVVCGIGAGLSPARFGTRGNLLIALQSQSGSRDRAVMPSRLRTSFVGFQAAVSMLLLVLAALLTRSALKMTGADVGFDAERLLVVSLEPLRRQVDHAAYLRAAIAAARAVPSVEHVSVTEYEPFGGSRDRVRLAHDGGSYELAMTYADAEYFATAGLRILRGRFLTSQEVAGEVPVAVISEDVASTFFGTSNPLGQSLSDIPFPENRRQPPATIVGVVNDAMMQRQSSERAGAIYRPLRQTPREAFTDQGFPIPPSLIVRTATPAIAARTIEDALQQVDPGVRPTTRIVRDSLDDYLDDRQRMAFLVSPIALLALALSALGVYGVTSFVVGQRASELSVRMAIGATSADVLRMLVKDSLRPVVVGVAVGLGLALAASRLIAEELAGISPHDPLAVAVAVAILVVGALAAVVLPARRAATLDPASMLRET